MDNNLKNIIIEKSIELNRNIDIKNDGIFKYIFMNNIGIKYMCLIISELFNINYNDLIHNIELINTELPRSKIDKRSSNCDLVYKYKNNIIIIEMNKTYNDYVLHKSHFYLMYKQIINSFNDNKYGKVYNTYLIDIDNYDYLKELNKVKDNEITKSIYKENLVVDYKNIIVYKNIKNIHINLDNIKRMLYNYNALTNIEKNCIIFIETDEKILNKNKKRRR